MAAGNGRNKSRSLMTRVIIVLCLSIIPFNLLSICLSFQTAANLRRTYRQSITDVLESHAQRFSRRMENADFLLYYHTSSDPALANLLLSDQDWHYVLYRHSLFSAMEENLQISDSADALFVYLVERDNLMMADRLLFGSDSVPSRMPQEHLLGLIRDESMTNGKWHFHEYDGVQYLIRILSGERYCMGAYINCTAMLREFPPEMAGSSVEYRMSGEPLDKQLGYLVCSTALPGTEIMLHGLIQNEDIPKRISLGLVLLVVIFLLSLAIVPAFTLLFRKWINKPLLELQHAFRELERGNEDHRIPEQTGADEFTGTFQSFNTMAQTLTALRRKALEEAKQQHELTVHNLSLKLENLQLQIRPHFLLNTMNLLFTLIHNHKEEDAKRLVLYLSKYFRYMFRFGQELELFDREVEMVREYLSISGLHYSNAFTVSYQLDPLLSFMRFPPLLLHNFVENIMQHALVPGETVHIVLYGEYNEEEKTVTLQISDDGRGMPEKFVEMINSNDFSSVPEGRHIGIRNSINRLQYYYEGKATVSVESVPQGGTTFTITIPQELIME